MYVVTAQFLLLVEDSRQRFEWSRDPSAELSGLHGDVLERLGRAHVDRCPAACCRGNCAGPGGVKARAAARYDHGITYDERALARPMERHLARRLAVRGDDYQGADNLTVSQGILDDAALRTGVLRV